MGYSPFGSHYTNTLVLIAVVYSLKRLWRVLVPSAPSPKLLGGYKEDIVVPHTKPVELYFADISACSMKVSLYILLRDRR